MKKRYGIAGACCLAGVLLIGVSWLMMKGDSTKMNSKNVGSGQERVYECASSIDAIYVKEYSGAIKVLGGDVSTPKVEYVESNRRKFTITEENGVLRVEREKELQMLFWMIDFNRYEICVTVPRDYAGMLDIHNSSGIVDISDLSGTGLSVKNTSGRIQLTNVSVDGDIQVDGSSGSIKLEEVTSKNCHVENSSGSIKLDEVYCQNCDVQNTSGSITLDEVTADGNVKAKNSSGGVRLTTLRASGDISLSSTSGSIKGSIAGAESDFSINVKKGSGSCNLANSTGGSRVLQVKNTSGGIHIGFTE